MILAEKRAEEGAVEFKLYIRNNFIVTLLKIY